MILTAVMLNEHSNDPCDSVVQAEHNIALRP
jgi:hypothetical protein